MTEKRLITEPEAAKILRRSPRTVCRLRLSGKLAYIPGRPVLIDMADLDEYIESVKEKPRTEEEKRADGIERARENARKAWLKQQAFKRAKARGNA